MSIIQEALKKVQVETHGEQSPKKDLQKEFSNSVAFLEKGLEKSPSETRLTRPLPKINLLAVLVALIAIVLFFTFTARHIPGGKKVYKKQGMNQPTAKTATQESLARPAQKAEPPQTAVPVVPKPDYKLIEPAQQITDIIARTRLQQSDFILNGIMYLEAGPRAIINNNIVEEGDVVKGATVAKIDKKSVLLRTGDSEIILELR